MSSEVGTKISRGVDLKAIIGGVAVVVIASILVVLSQTVGPIMDAAGAPIGVIAPALWNSGALYLVFFFTTAALLLDYAGHKVGWDLRHAAANTALSILFVVPVVWLATTGGLLNDAFFVAVGWPAGTAVVAWSLAVLAAWMAVQGTFSGFAHARMTARS